MTQQQGVGDTLARAVCADDGNSLRCKCATMAGGFLVVSSCTVITVFVFKCVIIIIMTCVRKVQDLVL